MSLITTKDVVVRYGGQTVLDHVSIALDPGEIVTIVGPNGSGKSTILRVMIGALKPTSGDVIRNAGLRIGYVPQKLHIDPTLPLTVRRFLDLPRAVKEADARAALEAAGLGDLSTRQMTDLSGGQFQRVLLARAILGNPQVLMLD
ncbi:MAG: ATP-binding cassette domain-containing protein, partial [Pseudomonadota bacterium]